MNLYLHAGAHKTASSFLQTALKNNQHQLFEHGLKVVLRKNIINSPFQKCLQKVRSGEKIDKLELTTAEESLRKMLPSKSDTDCLLTNEDLFCNLKLQDFYPRLREQLQFIANSVPTGVTPKFVLYIRRQSDYIESVYMQYIHLGRSLSFDSYLGEELPSYLSWYQVASIAQSVFGKDNVLIRPFETIKSIGSIGFYTDFLTNLNVKVNFDLGFNESLETQRGANRSYSALGMKIAKVVNPMLESQEDKNNLRTFLQSKFSTATHDKASFLSESDKKELLRMYSEENKKLFDEFIPGFCPFNLKYC